MRAIKLYSSPPYIPLHTVEVLVDGMIIGFFQGDGIVNTTAIVGCDPEVKAYLEAWIEQHNRLHPECPLFLTESIMQAPGDKRGFATATKYCYKWYISSGVGSRFNWLRDAFRELGILKKRTAAGIPRIYFEHREQALRLIAGLLITDGWWNDFLHVYYFSQAGDNHLRLVQDLRDLATRFGINCSSITKRKKYARTEDGVYKKDGQEWHWEYIIELSGPGIEDLQPYIIVPRKKIPEEKKHKYFDTHLRHFHIFENPEVKEYCGISVEGGQFLHHDNLVLMS